MLKVLLHWAKTNAKVIFFFNTIHYSVWVILEVVSLSLSHSTTRHMKSTPFWLIRKQFYNGCLRENFVLVEPWTENSDWILNFFLKDNHYKTIFSGVLFKHYVI